MGQRLAAAAEEGPALHRPRGTRVYGPFPLLPSNNPGFARSAAMLLARVPESAEHQHLCPLELFQVSDKVFRRQNVVSEGCEKAHTICYREDTWRNDTRLGKCSPSHQRVTFVPSLPAGRKESSTRSLPLYLLIPKCLVLGLTFVQWDRDPPASSTPHSNRKGQNSFGKADQRTGTTK